MTEDEITQLAECVADKTVEKYIEKGQQCKIKGCYCELSEENKENHTAYHKEWCEIFAHLKEMKWGIGKSILTCIVIGALGLMIFGAIMHIKGHPGP